MGAHAYTYIYSKMSEQPKYELLKRIINEINGVSIFTFIENKAVIPLGKVLSNSVFIMDDIIRNDVL